MFFKKRFLIILPLFILFLALVISGCGNDQQVVQAPQEEEIQTVEEEVSSDPDMQTDEEEKEEAKNDEEAESSDGYNNDFTLQDLDGNEVSLSDYEGQIVVINFWATWCNPCEIEIPDFVEAYSEYKDKGVQFLGVSDDNINSLKSFVEEYGIEYPVLVDGSIDSISSYWRISAIPTTYIVDGSGNAVFRQIGLMTKSQLVNAIEEQL
jgi:peroxiredoxin